jgi:hypothetical protein
MSMEALVVLTYYKYSPTPYDRHHCKIWKAFGNKTKISTSITLQVLQKEIGTKFPNLMSCCRPC